MKIDPELLARLTAEGAVTVREVNPAALNVTLGRVGPEQIEYLKGLTETEFQQEVIKTAKAYSWRVAHFRPVRVQRANGSVYYCTPVAADGEGFPDLELVRDRIIKAELKADVKKRKSKGKGLKPAQEAWRQAYIKAGVEWYSWEPADWPLILEVLK